MKKKYVKFKLALLPLLMWLCMGSATAQVTYTINGDGGYTYISTYYDYQCSLSDGTLLTFRASHEYDENYNDMDAFYIKGITSNADSVLIPDSLILKVHNWRPSRQLRQVRPSRFLKMHSME